MLYAIVASYYCIIPFKQGSSTYIDAAPAHGIVAVVVYLVVVDAEARSPVCAQHIIFAADMQHSRSS